MRDFANKIIQGDNLDTLKKFPDNSVSSIITDCPYGLQDIDTLKLIKENTNNTRGFMNKAWDVIPTIPFLKECHRVLKDGAFFITTFTPRQDLQCVFSYRLLEAGFDINFTPILWAFCQGFPKASDYSKMCQRRQNIPMEVVGQIKKTHFAGNDINSHSGYLRPSHCNADGTVKRVMNITKPTTPEAKYLDGLKSCQLKPSYEVIMIAQKPYKAKSKIDQALVWYNERREFLDKGIKEEDLYLYTKNASGGVRIDKNDMFDGAISSRIPIQSQDLDKMIKKRDSFHNVEDKVFGIATQTPFHTEVNNQGRFPATILVENNCLDVGREMKATPNARHNRNDLNKIFKGTINTTFGHKDTGDLSRYFSLDAWTKKHHQELYKLSKKTLELQEDAEKISPFLFTSKPSQAEKNLGLEEFDKKEKWLKSGGGTGVTERQTIAQNTHPTGKPISLYAYLINLFTFPNDLILDPYCGSGTTPIACVLTNRHYIGLELEKEYFDIAEARVKFWKEQKEYEENNKVSKEKGSLL